MNKVAYCKCCGWYNFYTVYSSEVPPMKCDHCNQMLWYVILSDREMAMFENKIKEVGILNFVETVREFI